MMAESLNSVKYSFSDFTLSSYAELVMLAKRNHLFKFYDQVTSEDNNFVLWRHDIDFSIPNSMNLAKIEKDNNAYSTFFVLLHCEHYNIFEKKTTETLKEIHQMGHQLGLHFDYSFYNIQSKNDLEKHLRKEKEILSDLLNCEVKVFSFHNPTEDALKWEEYIYGDMINTYSSFFKTNVKYASDSNGYWRFKSIKDTINENPDKPLQILTHPIWWNKEVLSPKEKILKCIDERAQNLKDEYQELLNKFGRQNIDW